MKIARFTAGGSDPQFGIVDDDDLVVLAGDPMFQGFETTGERVSLAEARLLAPVIPRSKIVCVAQRADGRPVLSLKPNTAIVGPGDAIQLPPVDGRTVAEGQLAIVIGAVAKRVRAEDADQVIFGYTVANDVSALDELERDGQWDRGKGYDTFCPIGPVIETEVDPRGVEVRVLVDGEQERDGHTGDLPVGIPELVEYVSDVWTLLPGDLILTGAVAAQSGFFEGQTVDVDVEGVGRLTNPARARA